TNKYRLSEGFNKPWLTYKTTNHFASIVEPFT
ncbi:MAG: hypothetical protein ACI8RW_001980, partial [Porticoccaceae bacterium]